MSDQSAGPGELTAGHVGQHTIASSYELTARRIMAYAAGIGDTNPAYFDDLQEGGLVGHPGMAFSFQWNCRFMPQVPPNPRAAGYGVHALSDLRMARPFHQGDVITCQGRSISIRQIPPGVLEVSRYRMVDGAGELVAELDMGSITRGATLAGGALELAAAEPGPAPGPGGEVLWSESVWIPRDAGQTYTECAQIYNPIHTERRAATRVGLPDIILHGSATQAISMSRIIDRSLDGDPRRLLRYAGQLRAMVLMETTIEVRCLGERRNVEGNVEILFDVLNGEGQPAVASGVVVASPL